MSSRLHDWCRKWLITADEVTTRARHLFGTSSSRLDLAPLRLSGLEPRILFSATPIDPAMMPDADQSAMVVEVGPASSTADNAVASIATLAQQPPADQSLREIVIIDSTVPDLQQLLDDLSASGRGADVFVLDPDRDGVEQITEILDSRVDIDSLHIVSHSENGAVKLGELWLGEANLDGYAGELASWQSSLAAGADILFYGCDLAGSVEGRTFVDSVSALTSADVAASTDDTGHADYLADWDLEYATGEIEAQLPFTSVLQQEWRGKLSTFTVTTFNDIIDGGDGLLSLREAILQVNAGAGGDTIILGSGTYTLSIAGAAEDSAVSGDLDLLQDVTITGAGPATTIIDASGLSDRVLDLIGSTATISGVTITGGDGVVDGGGLRIDVTSDLTLTQAIVASNDASNGGGIHNVGIVTVTDSVISDNGLTTTSGGGIFNAGEATLDRVTLNGNMASSGGGLYQSISATGDLSLTNVTVSGNTAINSGGGLYARESVTVFNSTFVLNSADSGGGIIKTGGVHTVNLTNTLVAVNSAASANPDIQGDMASSKNNLIGDGTGMTGLTDGVDGNQVGTGATPIDPLIDPALANNGGLTPTHAITASSPAYNAGTTSVAVPSVDQRGETRDGSPDIGAYEVTTPNTPPAADAGGPYTIDEGEDLVLDASGSFDAEGDSLSYSWDIDGDGQFDDAVGVNPTVDWATLGLMSIPINDDGSYTVSLRVDDGNLGVATDSVSLTVENVAPTLLTTGTGTATAGVSYTLNLSANDPGDDTITSWTIHWGDGTIETIAGSPSSVTHTYTNDGLTNNILVSATDEDGVFHQNELLVNSESTDSVMRYGATTGEFLQSFATGNGLDYPVGTVIGPDGLLYVTGYYSNDVQRYDPVTGAYVDTFVSAGTGGLSSATGIAFGPDGHLYVSSWDTKEVLRFDSSTGAYIDDFVSFGSGGLDRPEAILFRGDGYLYVGDWSNSSILRYDADTGAFAGTFVSSGSGGLINTEQFAFGPDGHLYVAGRGSANVLRYDGTTGAFIDEFVTAGSGGLDEPTGLAFGPDGHLYVASHLTSEILRFDAATGAFLDQYVTAGSGGLNEPYHISFLPGHQVSVAAPSPPSVNPTSGPLSYTEDSGRQILDAGIVVSDADGTLESATIQIVLNHTATEDLLHFTNQNGITGSYNVSTGILSLNGTASVADYQTALRSIEYENTSLNPNENSRFVSISVNDGTTSSGSSRMININAVGPLAVDTTSDVLDGDITSISALTTDKGADGKVSLREAILAANATNGLDTIEFEIRDALVAGAHTIVISAAGLPDITDAIILDGSSDADFGATPIIEIDGSAVVGDGLVLASGSDGSVIRSLVVNRFGNHGIKVINSDGNRIVSNFVGTDVTGTIDLGNNQDGIHVRDSDGTIIGGDYGSEGNLLSGNNDDGIGLNNASNTVIEGNLIGTDFGGTLALGNSGDGISHRNGTTATTIGGTSNLLRNVISANFGSGVRLADPDVLGNTIVGNYIGTDINGNLDLGNVGHGILVEFGASNLTIGGSNPAEMNVISGNDIDGIHIDGGIGITIQGNRIGTTAAGTADLGNSSDGISLDNSTGNQIGGLLASQRNLISGNDLHGVHLINGANGNVIEGNYIGTNEAGTAPIGNTQDGIHVASGSFDNTIGGTVTGAGNLISGNGDDGIMLYSAGTTGNEIYGNLIGTDITGTAGLGNVDLGIGVRGGATDNKIGGTALNEANTIAFNGTSGVAVHDDSAGTARNRISGNSIHSHAGLGIDLVDGNQDRQAASITSAITDGTSLSTSGTYADGALGADTLTVEYFKNSGNAQEGKTYLGSDAFLTDATGNGTFNHVITAGVIAGEYITATVTDSLGNTSEFSLAFQSTVSPANNPPTVANAIPDQTTAEDAAYNFQFSASTFNDLDGDTLSYSASQSDSSPLPSWLSFDATTRTFSGTPTNADVGPITIRVTATDPSAASTFDDFVLTVDNVNDAPTLDNSGDLSLDTIDQDTPSAINNGNSVVEILASGGGSPIADVDGNLTGIAVISVDDSNGSWEFSTDGGDTWNGIDPDGGGATEINSGNTLLLVADAGDQNRIRFIPDAGFAGSAGHIDFHAWDGTELPMVGNGNYVDLAAIGTGTDKPFSTATEEASLWVNAPPTITPIDDQAIMVNTSSGTISFIVSDAEDSSSSLIVTATSSNTALVPNANITITGSGGSRQVEVTPSANQIGSTVITLTLTDANGAETQSSFDLFVAPHIITVTTGDDVVDAADLSSIATLLANSGSDGAISLREAIIATNNTVNGADPDLIILPSGTYMLDGNDLDIVDSVKIQGAAANTTVIDADARSLLFNVSSTSRTAIHDVTLQNAVDSNGAILVGGSATLSLFDSTLRDNTGNHGGALHVDGTLNANRVTFTNNSAAKGGAIYLHGSNAASLTNVTISGNEATDKGGAIFADHAAITMTNSTIAFNDATNDGAALYGNGGSALFTLRNTILAENHLGNGSHQNVATGTALNSLGNNIDSDGTAGITAGGDLSGTPTADLDVGLVALAYNGGTTKTHALAADSIAIDAGSMTGAPAVDQRGTSRPIDGDGDTVAAVDIGAFESSNAMASGSPSILGLAQENETLTADTSAISDPDGIGPFAFQWLRDGVAISGATANTYVLGDADVGAQISVDVSYIDGGGTRERLTSTQVGPVANVNDSPVGTVNIAGVVTQGQVLTASNAFTDDDGVGVVFYQWKRDGIAISGATAQNYTLTDADVGTAIMVVATYTDHHGTNEIVISSPTAPVVALPLPPPPPPPPIDPGGETDPPPVDEPADEDPAENPDDEDEGDENINTNLGPSVPPSPPKPEETPDPNESENAEPENETPVVAVPTDNPAAPAILDDGVSVKGPADRHGDRGDRTSTEELIASGEHAEYAMMSRPGVMWNELDERLKNIESHVHGDLIVVGTAGAAASSFTVGVVAWTLRTGFLASGLLAQMPAWRTVDPMLIMQSLGGGEDAETLEQLMERERESLDT